MKASLISAETGTTLDLHGVSVIGRSTECQLIVSDPRVSRRHAMIRRQEDGFWFFDLGSFNGSYINGARVTAARHLRDGDVLSFADHEFSFSQLGSATQELEDVGGQSTIALIRRQAVIILVSDIRGFTTLSEQLPPDDLAQVMGSWYGECEQILGRHGATVDKFIGDCVLAYWTEVTPENLRRSLAAAKDLLQSCQQIYEQRQETFQTSGQSFGAGVAMHTGTVAYGGMSHGEFTLVGDPVNLTFRIEGLTRNLGKDVLVTKDFLNASGILSQYCENLGFQQVKGRAQPVEVWGVHTFPD